MVQTLDLRKKTTGKPKQKIPANKTRQGAEVSVAIKSPDYQTSPQPKILASPIVWDAPSFYFNPQKKYLSLVVIALASGGAAMLFYQRDALTSVFLLLSSLVLVLYSSKRPEISRIRLDQGGISIGEMTHRYKDLKSFWIHYDPGVAKELSLESKKWFLPYIKVSIENNNPLVIRSLLVNFLPEKEHENSLVDILSRRIGL